jgi:PIN domain nuclease of toxin-antitoxin system
MIHKTGEAQWLGRNYIWAGRGGGLRGHRLVSDRRRVLDATALLAYLGGEPGVDVVSLEIANGAAISTVNLAEVLSIIPAGFEQVPTVEQELRERGLLGGAVVVEPFTVEDAIKAAYEQAMLAPHGLVQSLGKLACSALASRYGTPPVGTDVWIATLPDHTPRPSLESPASNTAANAVAREARMRAAPHRDVAETCSALYASRAGNSLVARLVELRRAPSSP